MPATIRVKEHRLSSKNNRIILVKMLRMTTKSWTEPLIRKLFVLVDGRCFWMYITNMLRYVQSFNYGQDQGSRHVNELTELIETIKPVRNGSEAVLSLARTFATVVRRCTLFFTVLKNKSSWAKKLCEIFSPMFFLEVVKPLLKQSHHMPSWGGPGWEIYQP